LNLTARERREENLRRYFLCQGSKISPHGTLNFPGIKEAGNFGCAPATVVHEYLIGKKKKKERNGSKKWLVVCH
jgi:hypothetical protein